MKGFTSINTALLAVLLVLNPRAHANQPDGIPGRAIMKVYQPFQQIDIVDDIVVTGEAWFDAIAEEYFISSLRPNFTGCDDPVLKCYYIITCPQNTDMDELLTDLSAETQKVKMCFQDRYLETAQVSEPDFENHWHHQLIRSEMAWNQNSGSPDIIIAIVDTGIDLGLPPIPHVPSVHQEFKYGGVCPLWNGNGDYGFNLYWEDFQHEEDDPRPWDPEGHGTHVAALAAAITNNGALYEQQGCCGIAGGYYPEPGCTIMIVRACDLSGSIWLGYGGDGIIRAADNGADVISCSWRQEGYFSAYEYWNDVVQHATNQGAIVIACAGNCATEIEGDYHVYPGELPDVICVGGTNRSDEMSPFTNFGAPINISSPSGQFGGPGCVNNIFSALPRDDQFDLHEMYGYNQYYDWLGGTSMGTPLVSGLAGLILSEYPGATINDVRGRILGTAVDITPHINSQYYGMVGAGRIDAYDALDASEHPNLVLSNIDFVEIVGNSNGYFNPGETVECTIELKNYWVDATDIQGTLSTELPYITITNPSANWGSILQEGLGSNSEPITISASGTAPPGNAEFSLLLQPGGGYPSKEITFIIPIIAGPAENFPVSLINFFDTPCKVVDLDQDGTKEFIIASITDEFYVVEADGTYDIWQIMGSLSGPPAIGDLDNDGDFEVCVGAKSGYFYVWDHQGQLLPNFPFDTGNYGIWAAPALSDIDNDGNLEIIFTGSLFSAGVPVEACLYVLNHLGSIEPVFLPPPVYPNTSISFSPALHDLDGDYHHDIIVLTDGLEETTNPQIVVRSGLSGDILWVNEFGAAAEFLSPPVVGDLDNDGTPLCIVCYNPHETYPTKDSYYYRIFNPVGAPITEFGSVYNCVAAPAESVPMSIGNIHKASGELEFVQLVKGYTYLTLREFVILTNIWQIQYWTEMATDFVRGIVIADLDNDLNQETLVTYKEGQLGLIEESGGLEIIYDCGTACEAMPTICDYNADNTADIVQITYYGDLHVFQAGGSYDRLQIEWGEYQHDLHNSGCYSHLVSGTLPTNSTVRWSGSVTLTGSVTVPSTTTLIIDPGTIIRAPNDIELRLEVQGTLDCQGTTLDPIIFLCKTSPGLWGGIELQDDSQNSRFNHVKIYSAGSGISFNDVSLTEPITNVTFSNCADGIYMFRSSAAISNCNTTNFQSGIIAINSDIQVTNCTFTSGYWGFWSQNNSRYNLMNNTFIGQSSGSIYCRTGNGILRDLQIEESALGIVLINSSPEMKDNYIDYCSSDGLALYHSSRPIMNQSQPEGAKNRCAENEGYQIFIDGFLYPFINYGHNDFVKLEEQEYFIYSQFTELPYDYHVRADYNWWGGDTDPRASIYPPDGQYGEHDYSVTIDHIDPLTNTQWGTSSFDDPFMAGVSLELAEDYQSAIDIYQAIVDTSADSPIALSALQRIFGCMDKMGGDFLSLMGYYEDQVEAGTTTVWVKTCQDLISYCQVRLLQFYDAIEYYEGVINSSPCLSDSIYAVIDAGAAYLEMELSGSGTASLPGQPGSMEQLRPTSMKEYQETVGELLTMLVPSIVSSSSRDHLLPDVFALYQNYPNPFNPITTIRYDLPETAEVTLKIYNIMAQLVATIVDRKEIGGYKRVTWDGANRYGGELSSGMYILQMVAKGESGKRFVQVKKMLLIK